jgi:hypothetical protein
VPPEFSRDYVAAKQKLTDNKREDVRLVGIAGAGHYDLIDPRTAAWKEVAGTVSDLLS